MADRASVTDSPWFWVAAFSAMALLGLFVVGPKYAVREASWEQKLITRSGIQRPDAATNDATSTGKMPVPPDASTGETPVPREDDSPPQPNLLVPLWRLKLVAVAVCVFAYVMLWRQRRALQGRGT